MPVNAGAGISYGFHLFKGGMTLAEGRGSLPESGKLAPRRAWRRGFPFAGTILGIAFSLIPLILVLEVTSGMMAGITDRYLEIGTFHIQGKNYLAVDPASLAEPIAAALAMPGVRGVIPCWEGSGLLWYGGTTRGGSVRGYPPGSAEADPGFSRYFTLARGSPDLSRPDSIILSSGLADELSAGPGSEVKLLTSMRTSGGRYVLRPESFVVTGVYSTGYRELDSLTAIIPRDKAELLFRDPGSFSIGVKVDDPYGDMREITAALERAFPRNWHFYTWYELEKPMYKSFQTTKSLLTFIMAIILLVGIFNISASLTMVVLENQQEIAVLKSIGVDTGTILGGFLFAGFLCGTAGVILGTAAGLLCSASINEILRGIEMFLAKTSAVELPKEYYLEQIPISIDWLRTGVIALLSVVLSVVASIVPARNGARLSVMDVMRRV
jgi:lipoprotein-releasing system permease protein